MTSSKMKRYRLFLCGEENLYLHGGKFTGAGWPLEIQVFVKDPGTRAIVGRWLPCPNGSIATQIRRLLGASEGATQGS